MRRVYRLLVLFAVVLFVTFFLPSVQMGWALDFPFVDQMESTDNWTATGNWTLVESDYHSESHCYTDSPGGAYGANENITLTTKTAIDLSSANRPLLEFWHRYNLEEYRDFAYVEVSTNGSNWERVFTATGYTGDQWIKERIDLSEYAGESLYVRFRLVTNGSIEYDGWYIDDVSVVENTATTSYPFFDDMESEASELNWIASSWKRTNKDSYSGTYCWTDSPNGSTLRHSSLVLAGVIDLSSATNPQLSFWHQFQSYSGYYIVQISHDGGHNWEDLARYSSQQKTGWRKEQIDLSPYVGLSSVVVRFTTNCQSGDGWYIDDVRISDGCPNVTLDLPFNITEHSMELSWSESDCPDFAQYEVYRDTEPGVSLSSERVAVITDRSVTSFTDTNIPRAGTTYYYKVFILDTEGLYNQGSNEVDAATAWGITDIPIGGSDDMESGDRWGNDQPWSLTDQ
ncbi:MAG: hypothetical protein DRG59_01565, partial [Deltaproteobacteria bacterium]